MNDEYQTRQFFNMRPETTIKLKRIIKEEIRSVLEVIDPRQLALNDLGTGIKKELGIKDREPGPSKNKFREKDYEVGYKYYAGDDYEWDTVTVTAKSPKEAIAKVKNREVSGVPRTASDIAIVEPRNEEFKRMQELAGISENEGNNFDINQYKEEALGVYDEFVDEFESQGLFEFIPDLEDNYVDSSTNSLNIEELGSIYLIPNEGPIPNEVKEFMNDSNDGEINEQGVTWKKYPQNGYYYIAMS